MTKIFFDSNVILDALTERDQDYKPAQKLIRLVASGSMKGYISAKQITDIYYILRKYCSEEIQRKAIIETIINTFEVIPTIKSDIQYCLKSDINDLEDALIDEVCKVNCINYLVTNNVDDFRKGKSTAFTPNQLITILEMDQ